MAPPHKDTTMPKIGRDAQTDASRTGPPVSRGAVSYEIHHPAKGGETDRKQGATQEKYKNPNK